MTTKQPEQKDWKAMDDAALEKHIVAAARGAIAEAVRSKLSGYQSPLDEMIKRVVGRYEDDFETLLSGALVGGLGDTEWRAEIGAAIRSQLAKLLISKMGGELEKQVNALKSDPTSRARITTAIDDAVKSLMK